jgi:hypothetical protein
MYEAINRFLDHPDLPERYDELFGTDQWRSVIPEKNPEIRRQRIHDIYKGQLEGPAHITFVRSFQMMDSGNRTEYFLFFGTNNLTGLKKMKEAMWKVDKAGRFQFSDATANPNQGLLFEAEPNYALLKNNIVQEFRDKEVTVEEIERFVLTYTPFRETHFKRQILKPMEETKPPQLKVVSAKVARKKGNFPAGTHINSYRPVRSKVSTQPSLTGSLSSPSARNAASAKRRCGRNWMRSWKPPPRCGANQGSSRLSSPSD